MTQEDASHFHSWQALHQGMRHLHQLLRFDLAPVLRLIFPLSLPSSPHLFIQVYQAFQPSAPKQETYYSNNSFSWLYRLPINPTFSQFNRPGILHTLLLHTFCCPQLLLSVNITYQNVICVSCLCHEYKGWRVSTGLSLISITSIYKNYFDRFIICLHFVWHEGVSKYTGKFIKLQEVHRGPCPIGLSVGHFLCIFISSSLVWIFPLFSLPLQVLLFLICMRFDTIICPLYLCTCLLNW